MFSSSTATNSHHYYLDYRSHNNTVCNQQHPQLPVQTIGQQFVGQHSFLASSTSTPTQAPIQPEQHVQQTQSQPHQQTQVDFSQFPSDTSHLAQFSQQHSANLTRGQFSDATISVPNVNQFPNSILQQHHNHHHQHSSSSSSQDISTLGSNLFQYHHTPPASASVIDSNGHDTVHQSIIGRHHPRSLNHHPQTNAIHLTSQQTPTCSTLEAISGIDNLDDLRAVNLGNRLNIGAPGNRVLSLTPNNVVAAASNIVGQDKYQLQVVDIKFARHSTIDDCANANNNQNEESISCRDSVNTGTSSDKFRNTARINSFNVSKMIDLNSDNIFVPGVAISIDKKIQVNDTKLDNINQVNYDSQNSNNHTNSKSKGNSSGSNSGSNGRREKTTNQSRNSESPRTKFYCPTCNKGFTEKFNMKRHMQIHFPSREKYECDECSKSFAWKDNFIRHKKAAHGASAQQCAN